MSWILDLEQNNKWISNRRNVQLIIMFFFSSRSLKNESLLIVRFAINFGRWGLVTTETRHASHESIAIRVIIVIASRYRLRLSQVSIAASNQPGCLMGPWIMTGPHEAPSFILWMGPKDRGIVSEASGHTTNLLGSFPQNTTIGLGAFKPADYYALNRFLISVSNFTRPSSSRFYQPRA